MSKKVAFSAPALPPSADAWVGKGIESAPAEEREELKRLTLDIPKSLHARFKADCALNGTNMVDVVIEFLKEKYPPQQIS